MQIPHVTTIRDIASNSKHIKKILESTKEPIIVTNNKKPQFALIALEQVELVIKQKERMSIKGLINIANFAKKEKINAPKDMSINHDAYLYEEETQ